MASRRLRLFARTMIMGEGIYQGGGVWLDSTCLSFVPGRNLDGSGTCPVDVRTQQRSRSMPFCPAAGSSSCSDRRGGMHRCASEGNDLYPEKATLVALDEGGRHDLFPISWHETHEFQPSLPNDGDARVYTMGLHRPLRQHWPSPLDLLSRWSRSAGAAWQLSASLQHLRRTPGPGKYFRNRVFAEWNIRAVPDSPRYIATAGPHHGQPYGSLVLIDLRVVDDDGLSQVTRITPDVRFPNRSWPHTTRAV